MKRIRKVLPFTILGVVMIVAMLALTVPAIIGHKSPIAKAASSHTFTFVNNTGQTIWAGAGPNPGYSTPNNGGWAMPSGSTTTLTITGQWGGRFWGRTYCNFDSNGNGHCETGDCGGVLQCNGNWSVAPNTLGEFYLPDDGSPDVYNISYVDGFNIPMTIIPIGGVPPTPGWPRFCTNDGCDVDMNANCPSALRVVDSSGRTVACHSACTAFHQDQYCCTGTFNSAACDPNTWPSDINSAKYFKSNCPDGYSYAKDDATSVYNSIGSNFEIVFGPAGSLVNGGWSTGLEGGQPAPTWTDTVDSAGYPAGGISNVGGVLSSLSGPELGVRNETAYDGTSALMYSGMDNNASSSYAYLKAFDVSANNLTLTSTSQLSYWIYPQSSATNTLPSGSNSSCVALDLIFTDGTNLRDSGITDTNGNRVHPASQCGHLTLDKWNNVIANLGSLNGKTLSRIDIGYDQPANTGGYRGYIDTISLTQTSQSAMTPAPTNTAPTATPTKINTPPTATPGSGNGFTYGVANSGSTTAQVWFQPTGATASYVIIHFNVAGGAQQNVNMTYNSSTSHWEYSVSGMGSGAALSYAFTYNINNAQYDTPWYSWTHP
jgi:Thaumatin family